MFVLDMGEPVKILDLAERMIELSGLKVRDATRPDGDIEITVVGLRPGEKLYEELLIGANPSATMHPKIMKASEGFIPWPELEWKLHSLRCSIDKGDVTEVIRQIMHLVPDYTPDGSSVDWVHLERLAG